MLQLQLQLLARDTLSLFSRPDNNMQAAFTHKTSRPMRQGPILLTVSYRYVLLVYFYPGVVLSISFSCIEMTRMDDDVGRLNGLSFLGLLLKISTRSRRVK